MLLTELTHWFLTTLSWLFLQLTVRWNGSVDWTAAWRGKSFKALICKAGAPLKDMQSIFNCFIMVYKDTSFDISYIVSHLYNPAVELVHVHCLSQSSRQVCPWKYCLFL